MITETAKTIIEKVEWLDRAYSCLPISDKKLKDRLLDERNKLQKELTNELDGK